MVEKIKKKTLRSYFLSGMAEGSEKCWKSTYQAITMKAGQGCCKNLCLEFLNHFGEILLPLPYHLGERKQESKKAACSVNSPSCKIFNYWRYYCNTWILQAISNSPSKEKDRDEEKDLVHDSM